MIIRQADANDWQGIWRTIKPVFRAGESYPFARDITESDARHAWMDLPTATYVAIDEHGRVAGTYYIKPNQPGLGAHVANCGYIVSEAARGQGLAATLCQHSQDEARRLSFRAMQFNLVVATNEAAVKVWQRCGFAIVATLPGAFHHPVNGFVDAYVMYKDLIG